MSREIIAAIPSQRLGHLLALDGLRGVAILLVMVHHLFVMRPRTEVESAASQFAALGAHGVDLFFVLSGFLITRILIAGKGRPNQLTEFYWRRFLRIAPLYYGILGFCFLALPALMSAVPTAAPKLARFSGAQDDWIWYVFFLSNYSVSAAGEWRHGILDVTWSLAIEEQFYVVWPFVVRYVSSRWLGRVCGGVIAVALVSRIVLWAAGYSWLTCYVLTFCRMDALAFGSLLAVWERPSAAHAGLGKWRTASLGLLLIAGTAVVGLGASGHFRYDDPQVFTIGYTLFASICACVLILAVVSPAGSLIMTVLTSRVLRFFGKYSYCIYLVHLPIRAVIRDLWFGDEEFRQMPGGVFVGQALFYLVSTAVVVPVALASWHLLEKRALNLKKWFAPRHSVPEK